jgi:Ca2+-binding EF-hand superfamily protein
MTKENTNESTLTRATINLSQTEREDLEDAFKLFDSDEDGFVLAGDIRKSLEDIQKEDQGTSAESRKSHLDRLLSAVQKVPDDHKLSSEDFVQLITHPDPHDYRSEVQKVFDLFDVEGKGFIGIGDLKRVAAELGECLEQDEVSDSILEDARTNTYILLI